MNDTSKRTGGRVLVDGLKIHGVDTVFSVPGESFLPAIDALYQHRDSIRLVTCRQEGAATHMAEAYAKLTGKPGVALVTRGPGSTNASIAIHTARQDSTPLVVLVGQVSRHNTGREAWQELDYPAVFGSMTKWAAQVEHGERLPEMLSRAFHVAASGRPGPVLLALPEDLLYEEVTVADTLPYQPTQAHPGVRDLATLRSMLASARKPFVLLGGGGWNAEACADIRAFAERFELPVGTGFRRQDLFDNTLPNYAGDVGIAINPALAARVKDCDLLLAIGGRLGETTSSEYTLIESPTPRQTLVHVHADANELGRVYRAALPILSGVREFATALRDLEAVDASAWRVWTRAARADYEATLVPLPASPSQVDFGAVMAWLRETLPADAIVTNGAGNYAAWVHRFHQYRGFRTQLAPTSGTMGYGVPAAVAAKLVHPGRTVVCFAGDGCFMMNSQELATVRQYGLKIVFIVVNNGMYGSIRMHQELNFPGNVYGTDIENPAFDALARAYGLNGELIERTADFAPAFERALKAERATVIELRTDREQITPRATVAQLRARARS
jgi:acetolactate synthase-1/2/3 large subunit